MPNDYVCYSAGDPYVPPKPAYPKPNAGGTCSMHLIWDIDTRSILADRYIVTVADIEKWNKSKAWAWNSCQNMKGGYNLCASDGGASIA